MTRRDVTDFLGTLAVVLVLTGIVVAAIYAVLAYTSGRPAVRKATSTTTVWGYYGGLGWATDEGIACESAVLVDQETGVMYLMTKTDNDVDVTVLLNADGTVRRQVE